MLLHPAPCSHLIHSCSLPLLLQTLNVPVFEMGTSASPVDIARRGVEEGRKLKVDAIIIDTAGRLQASSHLWHRLWGKEQTSQGERYCARTSACFRLRFAATPCTKFMNKPMSHRLPHAQQP